MTSSASATLNKIVPRPPPTALVLIERIFLALGALVVLALKLVYPFVLRFQSDEPQHLHVVWGWARGLVPYRDVFDNHTPLFHLLCAPLFRALGERADIVVPMRFAMIPLYCLTLWCVFKISQALYSQRAALWTTVATALVPVYFFTSSEFRTDDLWIVFWMLSLLALVVGKSSRPLPFWTGFFMGCAFATSLKTSLLLGCLLAASACVGIFKLLQPGKEVEAAVSAAPTKPMDRRLTQTPLHWVRPLVSGILGMLLIPLLIVLFFYFKGAFHDLYYCVVQHNLLPGMGNSRPGLHSLRLPIAFPFLFGIGLAIFRYSEVPAVGARRALLFLTGTIYVMALRSYWPLITDQDYLPFVPLACIVGTPLVLWACDRTQVAAIRIGVPAIAILALLWMTVIAHPFWQDDTRKQIQMIQDVLNLTKADEFVMDGKGETIFRKRPFYYALEGITLERMDRKLIADTIVQRMIETETAVIHVSRLQKEASAFVKANYLPLGNLQILGQILHPEPAGSDPEAGSDAAKKNSDELCSFSIAVPSEYQIVSNDGPVSGTLDGMPVNGPRRLLAGKHELRIAGSHGPVALFWARAVERGYSPFKSP